MSKENVSSANEEKTDDISKKDFEETGKKVSPLLASDVKKESPFLATKATAAIDTEAQNEEEEDLSTKKKQHEDIDKAFEKNSIFNKVGKLYFFHEKNKKFETRGEGKIVIVPDSAGMYKLIMYRDKVMLRGANHYISPSCKLTSSAGKPNSWLWNALNDESDAEVRPPKVLYFATFKSCDDYELFEKKYNEAAESNAKEMEKRKK
ncbi:hypothetical protein ENBRE01_1087 [Enteropsectra breve]|nr:hypothetical protein ENBRE01_1087 [Enteropsectra breve]